MRNPVSRRCVLSVVSSVLLFSALSISAEPIEEVERAQFADGLYSRKMYELAAGEYKTFAESYPKSARMDMVLFRLGECQRQLGDLKSAEKNFRTVFKKYPQSKFRLKAGFRRADVFMQDKRYDEAIELFGLVLNEKPTADIASACLFFTGEAMFATGKTQEAIRSLEQVANKHSGSRFWSYSLLKLGEIYGKSKDPKQEEKALAMYDKAANKPVSPRVGAEAIFQVAEHFFRKKEFKKSAEAYGKLLKKYPSDQRSSEAALQAAWASHNSGLYADALRISEEKLKVLSEQDDKAVAREKPEWLYLKANCERQLMKSDSSVKTYGVLLAEYPESSFSAAARYETSVTYHKMGKFKEAIEEGLKIKLSGDISKDVYWLLAESYSALKKEAEAIQYYRLIVRDFPKSDVSADATYRLAHHLQSKGEFKEASRYYNQIAVNDPKSKLAARALFASAFCLSKVSMYKEAVRDWSALIKNYPGDALVEEALYQKAMGETRLKRSSEAMACLTDLIKRFPASKFRPDAHYWHGRLLAEAGKDSDAEGELREALKHRPRKELERDTKYHLSVVLHRKGSFEEAAVGFQSLLDSPLSDKFASDLLEWLSTYQFEKKKYDDSIAAARLIVKQGSGPEWLQAGWCLVGRGLRAKGDKAGAQKAYESAMGIKVVTQYAAEAALRLGELMLASGKHKEAQEVFRKAVGLASDETQLGMRARAYVGLARSAKAGSDYETAARYFMTVAVLYDDKELVPESLFEASKAFSELGKTMESRKAIDELMEKYPQSEWAKKAAKETE